MKKKLLITLPILLVLIVCNVIYFTHEFRFIKQEDEIVFIVKKKPDAKAKKLAEENALKKQAPIEIPDPSILPIQQVKDNKKPVIAFFYVDWCGYCQRFMPIYGEVAKEYKNKFNFAVVHCEKPENEELVKEFNVQGFPTLFIIDKKINYDFQLSGNVTQDAESLKKALDKYFTARKRFAK